MRTMLTNLFSLSVASSLVRFIPARCPPLTAHRTSFTNFPTLQTTADIRRDPHPSASSKLIPRVISPTVVSRVLFQRTHTTALHPHPCTRKMESTSAALPQSSPAPVAAISDADRFAQLLSIPRPSVSPVSLTSWQEKLAAASSPTQKDASSSSAAVHEQPLASIGVISDIQYCAQENCMNYIKTEVRYYRDACNTAVKAMQDFADSSEHGAPRVQRIMHLGDLIDGINAKRGTSQSALDECLTRLPAPTTARTDEEGIATKTDGAAVSSDIAFPQMSMYHLIGNHELVNFLRRVWADRLGMGELSRRSVAEVEQRGSIEEVKHEFEEPLMFPEVASSSSAGSSTSSSSASASSGFVNSDPLYYDFTLSALYRFVMLDAYDVAMNGRDPGDPKVAQAEAVLRKHNLSNSSGDFLTPHGTTHHTRRFVAFNGGFGERQMKWLVRVLEDAKEKRQYVILCSHAPFHLASTTAQTLAWNHHELLQIIARYPQIVACLHGHDHEGGHHTDEHGVHHHIFEAILTTPTNRLCHGRLDLFRDRIELRGVDVMKSVTMPISERARTLYHEQATKAQSDRS
jgi:manganese-dependent ADP-ribose/CDP-alcohol diphosphatase